MSTSRRLGKTNKKNAPHIRARVMPRLTDTTAETDSHVTRAGRDPPDSGRDPPGRPSTSDATSVGQRIQFSSSVHRRRTRRDRGVGTLARSTRVSSPHRHRVQRRRHGEDAGRARAGWNLVTHVRWPDGSLRKEYPPRNPYVVAARRRVSGLVHHCRVNGGDEACAAGKSYRFGVGVLWCAPPRYLVDKLGIHPETNEGVNFMDTIRRRRIRFYEGITS